MSSSSSSQLLSVAGWFFLPALLTSFLQKFYYKLTIRLGDDVPQPGSPKHERTRRKIHFLVIFCYLFYSIYEAYWNATNSRAAEGPVKSLYSILGVDKYTDSKDLRRVFRRLSVQYHPDKAGPDVDEDHYLKIKAAYDVLNNRVSRFGYDRFGSRVIVWLDAAVQRAAQMPGDKVPMLDTIEQFVWRGLRETVIPFYFVSLAAILILPLVGIGRIGVYWRLLILGTGLLTELVLITRAQTGVLRHFGLMQNQATQILRQLMITSFIAINQIGPLIASKTQDESGKEQAIQKEMAVVENLTAQVAHESVQSIGIEFLPFRSDEKTRNDIKHKLARSILEQRIQSDVEVKDASSGIDINSLFALAEDDSKIDVSRTNGGNSGGSARRRR